MEIIENYEDFTPTPGHGKKEVVIAEPFTTSEQAADFRLLLDFFGPMQGKNPEKGLAHLMNS
jgi:hypothetical protein